MIMEKKKKKPFSLVLLVISLFAVIISSLSSAIIANIALEVTKLPAEDFSVGNLNYYYLNKSNPSEGVAVGFGGDKSVSSIESITVESSVTYQGNPYEIKKVVKAGFRGTPMKAITLPSTILEIGEEAFAYCQQLKSFVIPFQVTEIKKSTFLDCRSLASVYYAKSDGSGYSTKNYAITSIDDHAFDSCINLSIFALPRAAYIYGESCFQNCRKIRKISFPTKERVASNVLEIGSFAFADCPLLSRVYLETNVKKIENYAFTGCANDLTINYANEESGTNDAKISALDSLNGSYWRRRYLAKNRNNSSVDNKPTGDLIRVNIVGEIREIDSNYPGLGLTIKKSSDNIMLDCGQVGVTPVVIINGDASNKVAIVSSFTAPENEDYADLDPSIDKYYVNGVLNIPDTISDDVDDDIPVVKIDPKVFENNTTLTQVKFQKNLKQIAHEAFSGCSNITNLDFSNCFSLREVSYKGFYNCSNVTALNLPYSLEYIGDEAFSGCSKVSSLTFYGNNRLFVKNSGVWKDIEHDLEGTVLSGFNAPSDSLGSNGNYYIDLENNKAYLKTGGTWGSELSGVTADTAIDKPNTDTTGNYYIAQTRLRVICERAFEKVGESASTKNVNLVLPETLSDKDANDAKILHEYTGRNDIPTGPKDKQRDNWRDIAIQRHAFDTAKCLLTVRMATATSTHASSNPYDSSHLTGYSCSLGTSAFAKCTTLIRFQASANLYTIGTNCFKDTGNQLREIFLISTKAKKGKFNYPYGISNQDNGANSIGGSVFSTGGGQLSELVIYIKDTAPKNIESDKNSVTGTADTYAWNVETAYDLKNTFGNLSYRSHIPAYFNVDWSTDIFYWKPNAGKNPEFVSRPTTAAEYNAGIIAFVKNPNDSSKYIATKYYCNPKGIGNNTYIDLSKVPVAAASGFASKGISNNLTIIGNGAFAGSSKNDGDAGNRGNYFVLPNACTTIEERAFFRQYSPSDNGARIVTYRDGSNKIISANGAQLSDEDFEIYRNGDPDAEPVVSPGANYCYLSDIVTKIGNAAFYGNAFASIRIGSGLTGALALGTGAFSVSQNVSNITSISSSSSVLTVGTSGGLYHEYETNKKILVYQPMVSGTTLKIDTNTYAVGRFAVAKTHYTTIDIPSTVTTLYGGAFTGNTSLTDITTASGLKYINAYPSEGETIWNSSMPFDINDHRDYIRYASSTIANEAMTSGAFEGCTNLTTIDIKSMTGLEAIGKNAFKDCSSLINLTDGSDSYTYKDYQVGGNCVVRPTGDGITNGVLDLTNIDLDDGDSIFRIIKEGAFSNCNNIRYIHLPATSDCENESKIKIEANSLPSGAVILTEETSEQASSNNSNWMNRSAHYPNGWNTGCETYFHISSATMISNVDPNDNSKGQEGSYYVNYSGSKKIFQKVNGVWTNVETGDWLHNDGTYSEGTGCILVNKEPNPGANPKAPTITKGSKKPGLDGTNPDGSLYLNDNNCLYEIKHISPTTRELRIIDDFAYWETAKNGTFTGTDQYWTEAANGDIILFKKENDYIPHQQARYYFYNL